ncbi:MAG: metallophosphoesterase [Methanobacterium sp.]
MSDSHDNLDAIRKAVNAFNEAEVDLVIHAGDMISPFTSKEIKELKCDFKAVFGNNDGERDGLRKFFKDICYHDDFQELKIKGKLYAVIHGTDEDIVDALVKSEKYDVVIRGHTHQLNVKEGKCMMINPGETCGYLSGKQTIILLNPDDLSYETVFL